ncbi:MAG: hypothetical protein KJ706_02545 [Candidatus Omnitrophica bacterium]|nr:hypothetical protein [Candidatus Omnitrophota bacterium]
MLYYKPQDVGGGEIYQTRRCLKTKGCHKTIDEAKLDLLPLKRTGKRALFGEISQILRR